MSKAKALRALAVAGTLALGGCDWWYNEVPSPDYLWHSISWFDHMIEAQYVKPYGTAAVPRYTPKGIVPVSGGEPGFVVGDPANLQYGFDTVVANRLKNPTLAGNEAFLGRRGPDVTRIPADLAARGDTLFQTYCAMCHGQYGGGNGPVGVKLGAPSLMTARARGYTDGYLYGIVRYGRGVMPQYGDKIYDPLDRWAVVNHLRRLQAAIPVDGTAPGGAY